MMIARTIYPVILHSISLRPVTLITGARQVGKTTLCIKLKNEKGYGYVSLRDKTEKALAKKDPEMFLSVHPWPLIIDEVQYAPELMECIESIVEQEKINGNPTEGMYVLTGSQAYKLMEKATDSLAGRLAMVNMSPLSMNEIICREEIPFTADIPSSIARSLANPMKPIDVFERIIKGMYPEPETKPELTHKEFYSDYVDTYIDRDVCELIQVRNKEKFHSFMQMMASLTGQELNYEKIANIVNIDVKTVKAWVSVLVAGDIIHLLQPYSDNSVTKRLSKRPKIYFWDTGLACYLARVLDAESLMAGYLKGPMVETFIINEILKSYRNNKDEVPVYFYRDNNDNEIDLVMVSKGRINLVECKCGADFGWNDIRMLVKGIPSQYPVGNRCIICLSEKAYPVNEEIFALPVTSI